MRKRAVQNNKQNIKLEGLPFILKIFKRYFCIKMESQAGPVTIYPLTSEQHSM